MDDENIYERIEGIFGHFPENFSILEEQIDIDLQMEYFEFSKKIKENKTSVSLDNIIDNLFSNRYSAEGKKELLARLASVEEVEAYRAIEKYVKQPGRGLKEWAILAFQESRMLLQSKLLDESQVFISTGLGGKGSRLRYFVVLINSFETSFDELQQNIIGKEFDYYLRKYDAELEVLNFMDNYCSLLAIVPIRASIREVFREAIAECNQYGGFIRKEFIVTNVKTLTWEEIKDFVNKQEDTDNFDE
ncbi:MAG: hypothetical protein R6U58_01195 [Bacteroidales bacterium]